MPICFQTEEEISAQVAVGSEVAPIGSSMEREAAQRHGWFGESSLGPQGLEISGFD